MDEFEELMARMLSGEGLSDGVAELQHYSNTAPAAADRLRLLHPMQTAAVFATLLLDPLMQGSALRLESLIHLSLSVGSTSVAPSSGMLAEAFSEIGQGSLGEAETVADQLFVGLIRTPVGGFRVLEGNGPTPSFHLQRFVNIVEAMPEGEPYDLLRRSIYALLAISDLVCGRAGLRRYAAGQFEPLHALPPEALAKALANADLIVVSAADLATLGVDRQALEPFVYVPDDDAELLANGWGDTPLERCPLLAIGDTFHLILPTVVSLTIRHFVISHILHWNFKEEFVAALACEHKQWFSHLRIIGTRSAADLRLQYGHGAGITALGLPIDQGRFLQILFVLDDLEGIEAGGFSSPNPRPDAVTDAIAKLIGVAKDHAISQNEFHSGLTLVVPCGIGRPTHHTMPETAPDGWRVEIVGAADLETLTRLDGFSPLLLWRLLDARDGIARQGLRFYLPGGLAQLVGQARSLEGHLVEHRQLKDGCLDDNKSVVMLGDPFALLRIRWDAAQNWDLHVLQDVERRSVEVSRESLPIFDEDRTIPSFIEEGLPLRGVFETDRGSWWWLLENDSEDIDAKLYRWQTMAIWTTRAAPVLEVHFPNLPKGPIEWRARFDANLRPARIDEGSIDLERARECFTVSADHEARLLHTRASAEYEKAFSVVENIAERALVEALVKAAAVMAAAPLSNDALQEIVNEIIPSPLARQTHAFRQLGFRDYVRESASGTVTRIELEDDAASRVGVGWRARARADGAWIRGKSECRHYLNALVTRLEDDLIAYIRQFDRRLMIGMILQNHELAARDTEDWQRTAAANLAFHNDKAAVFRTLGERESKLTAVSLTCRMLLEIAACECPLSGGRKPGVLDLSRLMSLTSQVFHFGGDSDAIHWDAMPAEIRITPLGDVHANRSFVDAIVEPFGRRNADIRFEDAIDDYADHFEKPPPAPAGTGALDQAFVEAVEETLGAPLSEFRIFLEFVEDLAIKAGKAILFVNRSHLLHVKTDIGALTEDQAERIVDALSFLATPGWRVLPEGYVGADRHLWRFRRQLSVLRRPLIPIDGPADPILVVAPGLMRQAWIYLIGNYYRGDFPDGHLSPKLASWKKKAADRRGKAFTQSVAHSLSAAGWVTYAEIKMTKLLGRGLERDFGDVDVLAYHPGSGRVLAIECKDVQYRKTYGEVAEQLADFRGGLTAKGKPDYLRRHLDRMGLIRSDLKAVQRFLKIPELAPVESHLIFRNPVPMTYALERLKSQVSVSVFHELNRI